MYLTLDDENTYIDVFCDGYYLHFLQGVAGTNLCQVYVDDVVVCDIGDEWLDDTNYRISRDNNQVLTVLENTPNRIKIRTYGTLRSAAQALLVNNLWAEQVWTVYPDRFTYDYRMEMSGDNELTGLDLNATMYMWHPTAAGYSIYYENGGSETLEAGTNARDSSTYLVSVSPSANFQSIYMDQSYPSAGGVFHQQALATQGTGTGVHRYQVADNPTGAELVQGIYSAKIMVIIDTIYREGSAKKYSLADRVALADQYKDPVLDLSPTSGSYISNMVKPPGVSATATLHTDGAHFYEPNTTPALKVEGDIKRCSPAILIRDWPYNTGYAPAPVDHLLCFLKNNNNAASSTLTDETGNDDATWSNTSDGSARDTDTTGDSVAVFGRGRNLDTQTGAAYIEMAVGAGTVHNNAYFKKGSILFSVLPQFAYDVVSSQTIFEIRIDASNYIRLWYDSANDYFTLSIAWGGTTSSINTVVHVSTYELNETHIFHVAWDSDKDFAIVAEAGQILGSIANTGTPSSSEPTSFRVGAQSTLSTDPGDIIIDEVKTFDVAVLPYGGHFIGNGYGLLYSINEPHVDLSWYFDGQSALAQGGTDLATSKNPTNTGGQFTTTASLIGTNGWDSNGTGNVLTITDSSEDIIDYNEGFVAIWFNLQTAVTGGEYLFDVRDGDGSDRISAVFDASGNIDITYRCNSVDFTILGDIATTTGIWYYLRVGWDTAHPNNNEVHSYINAADNGEVHLTEVWTGGSDLTWYFTEDYNNANGCDAFIGKITMGKKTDTPEVWTAFGTPIHIPTVDKV